MYPLAVHTKGVSGVLVGRRARTTIIQEARMAEPKKKEAGDKTAPANPKEGLSANAKHPTTPPLYPHPDQNEKYRNA